LLVERLGRDATHVPDGLQHLAPVAARHAQDVHRAGDLGNTDPDGLTHAGVGHLADPKHFDGGPIAFQDFDFDGRQDISASVWAFLVIALLDGRRAGD
jgi:hypothetical protein